MIVRFCGFGGQGILFSGFVFGTSAVLDGKKTLQTQSYGSESRGGGCRSDIIVSEDEIYELAPTELDVLVAFSQTAYNTYYPVLKKDGILFIEEDFVKTEQGRPKKTYGVRATDISVEKFGRKIMANMVMLGFICPILNLVTKESLKSAILTYVPKGASNINIKAFEEGYRLAEAASKIDS